MEDDLQWKRTSKYGDRISQQPLVRSYTNLKLKLLGSTQSVQMFVMKTTSNGRRPPTEDDLKIWKVEYLTNHRLDLTQIWNLSYWDQTIVWKAMKWRGPPMEEELQGKMTSKYEYLINHSSDLTQMTEGIGIISECTKVSNEDDIQQKTTSK